jgi:hypothetical protein
MLRIAGTTVLVTVVAVITLLVIFGIYKGVDTLITNSRVDDCLEREILLDSTGLQLQEGVEFRRWMKRELSRDQQLALYPRCSKYK